mmetsp:Transcript_289/g.711  ORF Transcript_289/g.711 Transcript_289/m.711 type:complete len:213 (-) Transcript_289:344-982(-)
MHGWRSWASRLASLMAASWARPPGRILAATKVPCHLALKTVATPPCPIFCSRVSSAQSRRGTGTASSRSDPLPLEVSWRKKSVGTMTLTMPPPPRGRLIPGWPCVSMMPSPRAWLSVGSVRVGTRGNASAKSVSRIRRSCLRADQAIDTRHRSTTPASRTICSGYSGLLAAAPSGVSDAAAGPGGGDCVREGEALAGVEEILPTRSSASRGR